MLAAYNHYLTAMFVPGHLAVYYPYQIHLPTLTIVCAVIVLGLATLLAIKNLRRRPYIMVGWLWYLGTLVPVIGLVQVGDQRGPTVTRICHWSVCSWPWSGSLLKSSKAGCFCKSRP